MSAGPLIYFARHAESTANAGGLSMIHREIPLSPAGLEQAKLLARSCALAPSKIVCSDMARTWQTSEPLRSLLGLPMEIDGRLDEFSYIDAALVAGLDGLGRGSLADAYWARGDVHFRQGESAGTFFEFACRVDSFMDSMASLPHSTVVFGHGLWLAMLAWRMAGGAVDSGEAMAGYRDFQQRLRVPNASVHVASLEDGVWSLGRLAALAAPDGAPPRDATDLAKALLCARVA